MRNDTLKALIGIGFAAIVIITGANAKADVIEGRNGSANIMKICSSKISKPTIVTSVTTLSSASASVAFRKFYKGSAPKVSMFTHQGRRGFYARALVTGMRDGISTLVRCYFSSKNGKVRH